MSKKILGFVTALLLFTFFIEGSNFNRCQEKREEKQKKEVKVRKKGGGVEGGVIGGVLGGVEGGVTGGVEGGVVGGVEGGVQGGVIGGVLKSVEEDFIKEPKKIIELWIEHIEIRPTETIFLKGKSRLKTESGIAVTYEVSSSLFPFKGIEVELLPVIIEEEGVKVQMKLSKERKIKRTIDEQKGIDLKIKLSQEGKIIKEETVFTRNLEPVIVEIFEKKDEYLKLAEKITPLVQVINPPVTYGEPIRKIEMINHLLLMNGELVMGGKGNYLSGEASSEDRFLILYYYLKDKGIYVLSFKPFEGAEPLGVVRDNVIKIKHNDDYFEWISMKPILPEGKWQVWIRNNPDYDPEKAANERGVDKKRLLFFEKGRNWAGIAVGEESRLLKDFFK